MKGFDSLVSIVKNKWKWKEKEWLGRNSFCLTSSISFPSKLKGNEGKEKQYNETFKYFKIILFTIIWENLLTFVESIFVNNISLVCFFAFVLFPIH